MKRVFRIPGQGRVTDAGLRGLDPAPEAGRIDAKVALIQALIPIGLEAVAEDSMVIALGITMTWEKVILGFVRTATDNQTICVAFLQALVDRGLRTPQELLAVIDGAKNLRKAIQTVFRDHGIVQHRQWHKRENVLAYLPKG